MPIDHSDPIYLLRQQLAAEITRSLGPGGQFVIAPYYGIPQPRMSELGRGIVDRCSMEWLIRRIYRVGGTVTLHVEVGDAAREWTRMVTRRNRLKKLSQDPSVDPRR